MYAFHSRHMTCCSAPVQSATHVNSCLTPATDAPTQTFECSASACPTPLGPATTLSDLLLGPGGNGAVAWNVPRGALPKYWRTCRTQAATLQTEAERRCHVRSSCSSRDEDLSSFGQVLRSELQTADRPSTSQPAQPARSVPSQPLSPHTMPAPDSRIRVQTCAPQCVRRAQRLGCSESSEYSVQMRMSMSSERRFLRKRHRPLLP